MELKEMNKVFFDTWGWIAIANRNDPHHNSTSALYRTLLSKNRVPVTTDYVIAETITLARTRMASPNVTVFFDALFLSVSRGKIVIEKIDEHRRIKTWEMSKKFSDKPNISFFDFTSFVVMKELGVKEALTADRHFEEIGMGFRKLF